MTASRIALFALRLSAPSLVAGVVEPHPALNLATFSARDDTLEVEVSRRRVRSAEERRSLASQAFQARSVSSPSTWCGASSTLP